MFPSDDATGVLLCGGSSRRLGFPKEMLRVDGAPLAVHMVRRLREWFREVVVSSNHPAYLAPWTDAPVIEDAPGHAGPLAGLASALRHVTTERAFLLACDMPLAHNAIAEALLTEARAGDAAVVIARADGRDQPLCGVYDRSLAPKLEAFLADTEDLSVRAFLRDVAVTRVDFAGEDAAGLRDVDSPTDLKVLRQAFTDVEPLPVRRVKARRFGRDGGFMEDLVAEEWAFTIRANAVRLATVMCIPNAVRELALGFARSLGLIEPGAPTPEVVVDYPRKRALMDLDVSPERLRDSVQSVVTSTCGANVFGSGPPSPIPVEETPFKVRPDHVLDCLRGLRGMAPVFERTGATHQAAFSDGERIRYFFEDVGRHNAVDKIVGAALLNGDTLAPGVLLTTGRLNTEMVVKAARARVPALASRGAPTAEAIRLADASGVTLIGFARNDRMNVYTRTERIADG